MMEKTPCWQNQTIPKLQRIICPMKRDRPTYPNNSLIDLFKLGIQQSILQPAFTISSPTHTIYLLVCISMQAVSVETINQQNHSFSICYRILFLSTISLNSLSLLAVQSKTSCSLIPLPTIQLKMIWKPMEMPLRSRQGQYSFLIFYIFGFFLLTLLRSTEDSYIKLLFNFINTTYYIQSPLSNPNPTQSSIYYSLPISTATLPNISIKVELQFNSQFLMNKIISKSKYLFSLFGTPTNEAIIRASIHSPISTESKTVAPQSFQYNSTKLPNGVTVLTESVSVPSNVHIGIFVDVGSRDESSESSGALLSLKNTYLKTAINTSETVNYGITQMAGGEFEMDYNRQNSYYHAYSLAHDVVDVFSMVADSAFQPKNFVSTSVGMYKNANNHKLETFLGGNQIFQDNIHQAAYGKNNLGNPIQGLRSNVNYLTASVIQKFQATTLNPKRIVISAAGVQNHQEFVDVVNDKFNTTILNNSNFERSPAKYVGGEVRNLTEANNVHIVLAFEGSQHKNSVPLLVAEEVLGNGRRIGRLQKNILNKHVFIDVAQSLNVSYSETGLFGIKVSGSSSHAKEILNVAARELAGLRNISEAELQLAKQSLKGKINRANLSTAKRLEERTKSLYYLGQTNENLIAQIDSITLAQVHEAVSHSLKTPLTYVSRGGEVSSLPSYDNVTKLFN